jgi:hypothetical protein
MDLLWTWPALLLWLGKASLLYERNGFEADFVYRYGISGALSHHPVTINRVNASVEFLDEYLAQGHTVYGESF